MADDPSACPEEESPLMIGNFSALPILAWRSLGASLNTVPAYLNVSQKNALLNLLGYDARRGDVTETELMELGMGAPFSPEMPRFIIPTFSGHGSVVTFSPLMRGIGRMAFLNTPDLYAPGASLEDMLTMLVKFAITLAEKDELVVVYTDAPAKASISRDYNAKVKVLELIDRLLLNPMADYVWHSKEKMLLAITSDIIMSSHTGKPVKGPVPTLVYYNDKEFRGIPYSYHESCGGMPVFSPYPGNVLIEELCFFDLDAKESEE